MTIKRYVNDGPMSFDLTYPEMLQAYREIQHRNDITEIEQLCSKNKVYLKKEELDNAATYYRELLDKNVEPSWHIVFTVCELILRERAEKNGN